MTEIEKYRGGGELVQQADQSVKTLVQRKAIAEAVLREVMKENVHYGIIPGTRQKSLYKPGAETIMLTFDQGAQFNTEDLSTPGVIRYRVTCEIFSRINGGVLGARTGECSSEEEKYCWRDVYCNEEWDATPIDQRREKWVKDWDNHSGKKKLQVRYNDPSSVANTVLSMAQKRAMVAAVAMINALGDIFAIGLDDIPAEMRQTASEDESPTMTAGGAKLAERHNGTSKPAAAPGKAQNVTELLDQLGLTEPGDDGKPKPSREGFKFISNLGVPKKWGDWTPEQKTQVHQALAAAIAAKGQPAPSDPAHSDNQQPPEDMADDINNISDPFADQ